MTEDYSKYVGRRVQRQAGWPARTGVITHAFRVDHHLFLAELVIDDGSTEHLVAGASGPEIYGVTWELAKDRPT